MATSQRFCQLPHRLRASWAAVCGLLAVLTAGCRREPTPTFVLDARDHAPAAPATASASPTPTAPVTATPAAPPAPAASAGGDAEYSAVELSGEIALPPGAPPKERLMVYITLRDCLNDASPLLRRLPVSDNRTFFAAVLAPYGSVLSVCVAAEPAPGRPAHLYGRTGQPLLIQKAADQAFRDLKVTLSEGSPRLFPTQLAR